MANFFELRRDQLGKTQRQIAEALGLTPQAVSVWENERAQCAHPVLELARVYDVSESKMEREVMALRRRIEARELATSKS